MHCQHDLEKCSITGWLCLTIGLRIVSRPLPALLSRIIFVLPFSRHTLFLCLAIIHLSALPDHVGRVDELDCANISVLVEKSLNLPLHERSDRRMDLVPVSNIVRYIHTETSKPVSVRQHHSERYQGTRNILTRARPSSVPDATHSEISFECASYFYSLIKPNVEGFRIRYLSSDKRIAFRTRALCTQAAGEILLSRYLSSRQMQEPTFILINT